jgi:hypothetical protein
LVGKTIQDFAYYSWNLYYHFDRITSLLDFFF